MKSVFYVYILFRPDGSPLYVGKGKGRRWLEHGLPSRVGRSSYLQKVINKAREQGLELPRLKLAENLTEQKAFEYERAFIAAIGRVAHGGPLANLTDGGEGASGAIFTDDHRSKLSAKKKGIPKTEAQKAAIKAGMRTPESIARQSAGQKKRFERSDEREKNSLRSRGKCSPAKAAHLENLRTLHLGRKNSAETIERMRVSAKARCARKETVES